MNILEVRDRIRACTACPLRAKAKAPVPWAGKTPASYLMLGMAPGQQENQAGRPFIGPAGYILRTTLKEKHFPMHDIAFANPVCCFPGRVKGGDARPTLRELAACRVNLLDQLEIIQPRFIFLLGITALEAFRSDLSLANVRGKPIFYDGTDFDRPVTWGKRHVICWPTYHPAATMRSKKYEIAFKDDLDLFWEWRRGGEEWPESCVKCHRPVERYDHWGIPTCLTHSAKQGELFASSDN